MKPIIVLAVCVACSVAAGGVRAAERSGTLSVDIKVSGTQSWNAGRDRGSARISETYLLRIPLRSDGDVHGYNPLDHGGYASRQLASSARVTGAALRQQGIGQVPVGSQEEYAARQKALGEQVQKDALACNGDVNCLSRLAARYSQQSNAIVHPAATSDASGSGRYMHYDGYPGCSATIRIVVDNSAEGQYSDVGGAIPTATSAKADYRGTPDEHHVLCTTQRVIHDIGSDRIHTPGLSFTAARGEYRHSERGQVRVRNADQQVGGWGGVLDWVNDVLREAPTSGKRRARLPAPSIALVGVATANAEYAGDIDVELDWTFESR